jgi:hypothetical protein
MKTSHVILALVAVAGGAGALYYFARKGAGDPRTYYPGSQGFPQSVPGGAPQSVQIPTPSGKGGTTDTILAAGAVGVALLPSLSSAMKDLFGSSSEPAAAEATASYEGLSYNFDAQGI